ncbi:hypothetical protein IIY66_01015 [Candidatus Saccharibacteria bacterium]|nr:hypothetical protein [Candidatus Saccharibacteria bacterium]
MNKTKNIKIIAMVGLICLALIVVVSAIRELTYTKIVDLYNINQVDTGLSGEEISDLEKYIWQSLKNSQKYGDDKDGIVALIRPSSFEKKIENGVALYRFLIDVDEFEVTYEISFGLVGNKGFYEPPTVTCPLPSQMKYPETKCIGTQTKLNVTVFDFDLPYHFRLNSGEYVIVTAAYSDDGQEYLNVEVSSCGDSGVKNMAREEVEEWLASLGHERDDYVIVISDFCDGSM